MDKKIKPLKLNYFLPDELKHFQLATGLAAKSLVKGRYTLKAKNYAELIDAPFELAEQTRFSFTAADIPHEFVVSGKHAMNAARMQQDIEKNLCHTNCYVWFCAICKLYLYDHGNRQ